METWLICHYKFISITILSISSDDFLHAFLERDGEYSNILHQNKFIMTN